MISKVLFRGKRKYAGPKPPWVYGYYLENAAGDSFIKQSGNGPSVEVIKETCGQYIGLDDKTKRMIFGGDIVTFCPDNPIDECWWWEVVYHSAYAQFIVRDVYGDTDQFYGDSGDCVIIGNIYDNPELMEKKSEE